MNLKCLFLFSTAILFLNLCSCTKEYSFEKAGGELQDSLGKCSPIIVSGTYHKGRSLTADSFYINVHVDVTKTGAYSISTNLVNGFQFSDSGTFNSNGIHIVKLRPIGQPINDTLSSFDCYFDHSICSFSIDVKDSTAIQAGPTELLLNSWEFTDSTDWSYHHGPIDPASTWLAITPTSNYLNIMGWPGTSFGFNPDTIFSIELYLPHPSIDTGTYIISSGKGDDNSFVYANNKLTYPFFFYYESNPYRTPEFIFKLISYDSQQRLLKGSFRGVSHRREAYSDYAGNDHLISGSFYIKVN